MGRAVEGRGGCDWPGRAAGRAAGGRTVGSMARVLLPGCWVEQTGGRAGRLAVDGACGGSWAVGRQQLWPGECSRGRANAVVAGRM